MTPPQPFTCDTAEWNHIKPYSIYSLLLYSYTVSFSYLAYCHSQVHFSLHYIETDWSLRGPLINIILSSDSQTLKAYWCIPFSIYTENKVVLLTI